MTALSREPLEIKHKSYNRILSIIAVTMEQFIGTCNTKKYTSDLPRGSRFLRHRNTSVTDKAPGRSRGFNGCGFSEFSSEAFHFRVNKTNLHKM